MSNVDSNNVIDLVRDLLDRTSSDVEALSGDLGASLGERIAAVAALKLLADPEILAREFARSEADADEIDLDDDDDDDEDDD